MPCPPTGKDVKHTDGEPIDVKALALSTFDSIEGPVMHFFVTDGFVSEQKKEEISSFLNFNMSTDYFILRVDDLTTYNVHFTIRSEVARGKIEMLMLSLVVDNFPSKKMESFFLQEAREFIAFLKAESGAGHLFHLERQRSDEEIEAVGRVYEDSLSRLHQILGRMP